MPHDRPRTTRTGSDQGADRSSRHGAAAAACCFSFLRLPPSSSPSVLARGTPHTASSPPGSEDVRSGLGGTRSPENGEVLALLEFYWRTRDFKTSTSG
ncbi:hypothetical protein GUJ93_ZPchr0013g37682 [Zizania palustris]|uniref:Uncharacterized protein n=1 Tax=Zizania palustris TaxID=103762 RepID=A0A8J6C141_ZIZPA|nr:hypothetical protein GUJ93_ZPchr0013g37682 [Zizania palustris]